MYSITKELEIHKSTYSFCFEIIVASCGTPMLLQKGALRYIQVIAFTRGFKVFGNFLNPLQVVY